MTIADIPLLDCTGFLRFKFNLRDIGYEIDGRYAIFNHLYHTQEQKGTGKQLEVKEK